MTDRKAISEAEVRAIVQAEIQSATTSTIASGERVANLNAYFARPYGNEIEGRSRVVSSAVRDCIEWIKPTVMRILTSGESVVSFEPVEEKDVQFAKQATEYVNYIWNSDNHGFLNFYSWITDSLISKVGTVKIWWDDTPKTKRERYSGLDEDTFAQIVASKDVEVAEHTANKTEPPTHDVVITRSVPSGKVCVAPVPPEEFIISPEARNIEDARLVGHTKSVTISELRAEGISEAKLKEISGGDLGGPRQAESIARNTVEQQTQDYDSAVNEAVREVWRTEAYIKIDVDGDGIAEMRKVTVAGASYTILSNEPWEGPRPFATLTPIIMPHRFYGMCPADLIKDLQLIQTTLFRQLLDNMYLSNNQREEVVEANIIDPDELLSSAPGRKIRVKAIDSIRPIIVPQIGPAVIASLEYLDRVEEDRTGVSQRTQGLGANQLHQTAQGERMLMSAAMGKIELMTRVMVETGVRDAFRLILRLVCMYQKDPRIIQLPDGWKPMDTTDWNPDMDVKTSVGIGTGDRDQQLMSSQLIAKAQEMLLPLGYVSPENLKNSAETGLNAIGVKGVDRFFTFPEGPEAKQPIQLPHPGQKPGPDPQVEIAKANASAQAKVQSTTIQARAKAETDQHLNEVEAQRDALNHKAEMDLEKVRMAFGIIEAHINAAAKIEAARVTAQVSDGAQAEAREAAGESAAA